MDRNMTIRGTVNFHHHLAQLRGIQPDLPLVTFSWFHEFRMTQRFGNDLIVRPWLKTSRVEI